MSDLLLNLMTIFNNSCIFYHIFLMLCCGILLKEIPSSMSNYIWHQRGVISFRVRGLEVSREWFGKSRVPRAGLASSQMARFSRHLSGEVCQSCLIYFNCQKFSVWRVIPLRLKEVSFSSVPYYGSGILRRKTHY